jgi:hypothetical protein
MIQSKVRLRKVEILLAGPWTRRVRDGLFLKPGDVDLVHLFSMLLKPPDARSEKVNEVDVPELI